MTDKPKGDPGDGEDRRNLTNKLTERKKRGQTQGNNQGEKVTEERESGHCFGNIFLLFILSTSSFDCFRHTMIKGYF